MDASFALGRLLLGDAAQAPTHLSSRDKEQVRGAMPLSWAHLTPAAVMGAHSAAH